MMKQLATHPNLTLYTSLVYPNPAGPFELFLTPQGLLVGLLTFHHFS